MSIDIVKDYLKSIFYRLCLLITNFLLLCVVSPMAVSCAINSASSRCLARCSIKRVYSLTDRRLFGL